MELCPSAVRCVHTAENCCLPCQSHSVKLPQFSKLEILERWSSSPVVRRELSFMAVVQTLIRGRQLGEATRGLHRLTGRFATSAVLLGLMGALTGCALHYGNERSGLERAWGLSRVTWEVERMTNGWATVSSGTRLPGLVLGVGPDFFGVAFGYAVRERLQIVSDEDLGETFARTNGRVLAANAGHHWGFGQLILRTPTTARIGVVSGRAGAGIGLGLESGRPAAAVGLQSRQLTTIRGTDVFLELTGPMCAWPHFDFPSTQVAVMAATNLTPRSKTP